MERRPRSASLPYELNLPIRSECFGLTETTHCMNKLSLQQCQEMKRRCGRNVKYVRDSCPRIFTCRGTTNKLMGSMGDLSEFDFEFTDELVPVIGKSEDEIKEESKCMVWIGDGFCQDNHGHRYNYVQKDALLKVGDCLDLCMSTMYCIGATYETEGENRCFLHYYTGDDLGQGWDDEQSFDSERNPIDHSSEVEGFYCYRLQTGGICPQTMEPSYITRHKMNLPDAHPDGCQEITIPVFCMNALFDLEDDPTWFPGSCKDTDPDFIEVTQFRPRGVRSYKPLDCSGDEFYRHYRLRSYRRQSPVPSGWYVSLSIFTSLDRTGDAYVKLYRGDSFLNTCTNEGFMYVKKICVDGAIIAKGYVNSDCSGDSTDLGRYFAVCSEKYALSSELFELPLGCPGEIRPRACCKALIASCLSCSAGQSIEQYCQSNPRTHGCPKKKVAGDGSNNGSKEGSSEGSEDGLIDSSTAEPDLHFYVREEAFLPMFEEEFEHEIHLLQSKITSWSYPSNNLNWGQVSPTCYFGRAQSPIDLPHFSLATRRPLLNPYYTAIKAFARDTGTSLQWGLQGEGGVQFYAHTGSEHTIQGEHADIEIHFVHQSDDGSYSVIGFLCNAGESELPFWSQLDSSLHSETTIDPMSLFHSVKLNQYYTYYGSFTTPPCTEGFSWIVVADFCTIPTAILTKLKSYPSMWNNYRQTQPLYGRTVNGVKLTSKVAFSEFLPYPGIPSSYVYKGRSVLFFHDRSILIEYDLDKFDEACSNGPLDVPNSCGIHIHQGKSCEDADEIGGHFWSGYEQDPWAKVVYDGRKGYVTVDFGYGIVSTEGRVFVIHDSNGNRITCNIIVRDDSDMQPIQLYNSNHARKATKTDFIHMWKNKLASFLETDYMEYVPNLWFFRESVKGPVGIHQKH